MVILILVALAAGIFYLKIYEPEDSAAWDAKYQDYLKYKWALQD